MNIASIGIKVCSTDFAFLARISNPTTLHATHALNRRIWSSSRGRISSLPAAAAVSLPILQLLHAFRVPVDKLAEFVGDLRVLSGQLAVLVPTRLPVLPMRQIKLLESVQSISCIFDIISDLCDAFIDIVSLDGILLVA